MKLQKYISTILDTLIAFVLLMFFASFGLRDGRTSGWYQQWFPNMNGSTITSMTFLDSLTGFAVTNSNSSNQSYILKTTNGGDNWNIQLTTYPNFNKVSFVDQNYGFASAYTDALFKTTNGGLNWFILSNGGIFPNDMAVFNKDTILYVQASPLIGGVFLSTNSGLNWQRIWNAGGTNQNPSSIYMFNKNFGFHWGSSGMRRTTDGGFNWTTIPGENYSGIQMADTLIGWKTAGSSIMMKTTNGGLNWFAQQLPNLSHIYDWTKVFAINKDTVWMIGNLNYFGLLYKTTNGGNNWGYQFADTSIHITLDHFINFVNSKIGWASSTCCNSEIHTITGGNDTTFFTTIHNNITEIAEIFLLYQNNPNPFNPATNINYKILKKVKSQTLKVKIEIYDINGKHVNTLVNDYKEPGNYNVIFDGSNLSSGIYFYSLFADGVIIDTKKMLLIK
jgi:photosystem II stability/assembly factor-like uncharacterized protein